jgi:acetamidase/formamidase
MPSLNNYFSRAVFVAGLALAANAAALEIPADYVVKYTPENAILGYFSATKKPVLTIKSGAVVRVEVGGGARWGQADPNTWLKENGVPTTIENCVALQETIKVLAETPNKLPPPEPPPGTPPPEPGAAPRTGGGHSLVGPIYVEDAEPGDALEIRILDVTPRIPYGTVSGNPGSGALPDLSPRPFTKVVVLDLKRNAGIFDQDTEVPLGPFNGVMATCPPDSDGPNRRSGPPGAFGGNLDCKELVAGVSLFLPVFQKGALYYTGDCHAAQGDGEITVNAIETANVSTLQFILHKGMKLKGPRAESATHYITFGLDPDLDKAMRNAMVETTDFLSEKKGFDFHHAYTLTSIAVDFRVTQVVDKTLGIHGMIPKKLFVHDANSFWYRPR